MLNGDVRYVVICDKTKGVILKYYYCSVLPLDRRLKFFYRYVINLLEMHRSLNIQRTKRSNTKHDPSIISTVKNQQTIEHTGI